MKEHTYRGYTITKYEAGWYITTLYGGHIGIRDEAGVWSPRYFTTLKASKTYIDFKEETDPESESVMAQMFN